MKINAHYSHLNGMEYLLVQRRALWNEIEDAIGKVDAEECRSKARRVEGGDGRALYSTTAMRKAMKAGFDRLGWTDMPRATQSEDVFRRVGQPSVEQRTSERDAARRKAPPSYRATDFVKDRVAVEVQFGKYAFVAFDLFVKHLAFYVGDRIDVGVEILPMKLLH